MRILYMVCFAFAAIAPIQPVLAESMHHDHQHHGDPMAADKPAHTDSLYNLDIQYTNQDGVHTSLAEHKGHPVVVSMFYSHCEAVCPLIVADMRRIMFALKDQAPKVRFVLISMDSERDTPAVLKKTQKRYKIDLPNWELGHANAETVRLTAAALGIKYRKLPDGEFNHTQLLTLLDAQGVPVDRLAGVLPDNHNFIDQVRAELK